MSVGHARARTASFPPTEPLHRATFKRRGVSGGGLVGAHRLRFSRAGNNDERDASFRRPAAHRSMYRSVSFSFPARPTVSARLRGIAAIAEHEGYSGWVRLRGDRVEGKLICFSI